MNDEKISFDLTKLFPEAAKRVEILEDLQKNWVQVVQIARARHSWPYNLGINEISVEVDSERMAGMIKGIKGNILRALEARYGYESKGEFILKVTQGTPYTKTNIRPKIIKRTKNINVDEEHVKELMNDAPKDLPENINHAISHLQALMEKLV